MNCVRLNGCVALCLLAGLLRANPAPTIVVDASHQLIEEHNAIINRTFFKWTATNADFVIAISADGEVRELPSAGEFEASADGGIFTFVAIGSSGSAATLAKAKVTCADGSSCGGLHGVFYDFSKEFDTKVFYENSYKYYFTKDATADGVKRAALHALQERRHTVDLTKGLAGAQSVLVYTRDYEENEYVRRTKDEKKKNINVRRQIAFVLIAHPSSKSKWLLQILPLVKKNYPDDNDKWSPDVDGPQIGRASAQALAAEVVRAID